MRWNSDHLNPPAEKLVKDIRRAARKQYLAEEKTRIMLEELRRERQLWRGFALSPISVVGQKRKSRTTILMSAKRPKAEFAGEARLSLFHRCAAIVAVTAGGHRRQYLYPAPGSRHPAD